MKDSDGIGCKARAAAAAILLGMLASAAPLYGQQENPAAVDETELLRLDPLAERMTVAVGIGEQGPFNFLVDTGAERTVISRQLASDLELDPGRIATMHSMTEVSDVATVVIPTLKVGRRQVSGIHAPALEQRFIGAHGMIGVDSLQNQRVLFDFRRGEMAVSPSTRWERTWPADTIVVSARRLQGRLVLIDAAVNGARVHAIVDTGSAVTIGNNALRAKLERRGRFGTTTPVELISVTGGRVLAEQMTVSDMRIGGVHVRQMPIAFAEVHPFAKLGLTDEPAILLGMDTLQLFERVSVDFANRKVRLLPGPKAARDYQMAEAKRAAVWTSLASDLQPGRR